MQVSSPRHNECYERLAFLYSQDPADLRELAHTKRFLERYTGDHEFRAQILAGLLSLKDAAKACGCELEVDSLRPVFHPSFHQYRAEASMADWPLTFKWDLYFKEMLEIRDLLLRAGSTSGQTREFDHWRDRQVARTSFELGTASAGLVHPTVAFELSSGCSVGCWFCGISAKKFGGHFTLADGGAEEWRAILRAVQSILGPGMATGFCYWATDPLDNPEYPKFIDIYEDVCGVVPQTTTAIPLRNIELTRAVLAKWDSTRQLINRFSVLSTGTLRKIHETFTPEEMLGVELVLQNKKSVGVVKFKAGRSAERTHRMEAEGATAERGESTRVDEQLAEGTIACVTGFLINILERTVRLVSPTMPSITWPDGYIVFDSSTYSSPSSLRHVMTEMCTRHMPIHLRSHERMSFCEQVKFTPSGDKPAALRSRWARVTSPDFDEVAALIDAGTHTPFDVVCRSIELGRNPLPVVCALENLWRSGIVRQHPA